MWFFYACSLKWHTAHSRARSRHLRVYCRFRLTDIWLRASRVFVPFGRLSVSVDCSGGRYRFKPRAASSGLLATSQRDLCQPPACVSIALAHRYAVRLLVGWSCPRLSSLAVIILYYTVPSTSIGRINKCTQYIL